ncbi:MAG: HAMP domain-containing protein, partial [Candidatus Binatia bacterium]
MVPFLVVIVVMGSAGSFLLVRFLSTRARDVFDRDLFRRSVQAEAHVFDRSLYLLDAVRLGSNFEGVAEAVERRDLESLREALAGVLVARRDLTLVVATDEGGTGLVEMIAADDGLQRTEGSPWAGSGFIADVLRGVVDDVGDKRPGFIERGREVVYATAGPIKRDGRVVGAMVAGIDVTELTRELASRVEGSVSLYDTDGKRLGQAGPAADVPTPPTTASRRPVRVRHSVDGESVATSYAELAVRGQRLGSLAVSLPDRATFSLVRGATSRLIVMLLSAMAAIGALGAVLSRYMLRQLRGLIEANRRFGRGDLGARAPLDVGDELGELARGFNEMADQLQASHEELESRVAQRTDELQRLHNEMIKAGRERSELYAMI